MISVLTTAPSVQKDAELQITRALVAVNPPFRAVENNEFKTLLTSLRPGTSIADRKKVVGPLLEAVYQEEKQKTVKLIKGIFATLAIDGWSNATNNPVIGVAFCTAGKTYSVDHFDTTGAPHRAEKLYEICNEQFKNVKNGV